MKLIPALILLLPVATVGVSHAAGHIRAVPTKKSDDAVVTLVTGDKVTLSKAGGRTMALVKAGQGREHIRFSTRAVNGHVRVEPSDATVLINQGRVDSRLFDVTQLVEWGYDDAKRTTTPLIATGEVGAFTAAGAQVTRQLRSVGGVSLTAAKDTAFWESFKTSRARISLSGKAKVLDAESNAQIGVPKAREAGFDGKGVTVGLLDTGVDTGHPDLQGVVTEVQDFTGSGLKDGVGHGTHVASIIAGAGAAYGGVAPKVSVVAGKVCGDEYCEEAAILAGMEWIAGKAEVVNMSLGSDYGTNDDLLSQAVNNLTASTGTLFVVSAGNSARPYTVASPSTADAALSVASVGRTDEVSGFSSKGPRTGDHALKPDITAPGENIVAARASGTTMGTPVGDSYVAASGTSMSSPHVTGVAALVAQAHPDWTAAELKGALMSSTAGSLPVFAAGAGRVDAARAVAQGVFADGSVSFGQLPWPRPVEPVTKSLTYRNKGAADVTLALSVTDEAFALSASSLVVPAGGRAGVEVSVRPGKLPPNGGSVGARVVATAGAVVVQSALGVVAEPESFDLSVQLLDRTGAVASNAVAQQVIVLHHTYDGEWDFRPVVVDGVAKVRVPKGDVTIYASTGTPAAEGRPESVTAQVITKFALSKDSAFVLDARKGNKVTYTVADRHAEKPHLTTVDTLTEFGQRGLSGMEFVTGDSEVYVVPAKAEPGTTLRFGTSMVLGARDSRYYLTGLGPENEIPARPSFRTHTRELARRDVRFSAQGAPADAEFARAPFYFPGQFFSFGAYETVTMPRGRTDHLSATDWVSVLTFQRTVGTPMTGPWGQVTDVTGVVSAGRPVPEHWNAPVIAPSLALAPNFNTQVYRYEDGLGANIGMFSPAAGGQGNNPNFQAFTATGDTTLELLGSEPVPSGYPGLGAWAGLPDEKARYKLTAKATRADAVPFAEHSLTTEASWTFSSAKADGYVGLPLMFLRTNGAFDGLGKAKPGAFPLSVEVLRQPRTTTEARVTSVTVEYSTDEGATWKRAPVAGQGNRWFALVQNPRSGFVSLRTSVSDSAGDTHSSSVLRAYSVK
ncbi:S8 family serine peptidase [Lentzea sp. NPDC051838]|uniref:S8 family peptidase n=1 Tax=Lentzea sp. NPDC051838 TaxID=3154849 RepID=UPI00343F567D